MNNQEVAIAMNGMRELAIKLPHGAPDFKNPVLFSQWANDICAPRELERVIDTCISLSLTVGFFPKPFEFIAAYDGVACKDDEIGVQVIQRIRAAMRNVNLSVLWDLDGNHPTWWHARHQAAEEYIGGLGWVWVQERGGWWAVCNGLRDFSETDWTMAAKAITADYKQQRAFGSNPPPIGLPGAARPALNESNDIVDVKQIRATPSSGVATQYLAAAAAEKAGERTTAQKVSLLASLRTEIEQQVVAERKAREAERGGK